MTSPLRCIIVEDEPLAAEILAEYIEMTPFLTLTHTCADAIKALDVVHTHPVDVIFLDINLPKLNGLEFIKTLRQPPRVIVTSAYHEFAVEGFDLQVTDYLLKPIEFSRFTKAANKLLLPQRLSDVQAAPGNKPPTSARPYYFFTVSKRSVKIYLDEILFIESLKDSVSIHTPSKSYQTHYQLGELEELMRSDNFLRIHRSFLVAMDKIESFSAAEVEIAGRTIPIGRSHKEYVMERLGR
ncbi:MAG: response regulator transcription factor [Lewinellaceae bacterium]|nr:response regulator transcription factor [Saprospiraceae bacterium]MCB9330834.1 response regulator transcription factor [Lewinellaceae bacterium]